MKSKLILGLLSGATIGLMAGCNNIERENKDVSTNAATLSADTLETLELTELDADRGATAVVTDTTPTAVSNNPTAEGMNQNGYTETEVVQIDTISTRIVYDVRRRTIEQVDTVGATKTYEIKKRILKRTVMLDTLTETEDREQTVAYQKGDFKVLDEKVETDSVVEIVDYQQAKREAAQARAKAQSSERQNATAQEPASQDTSAQKPASSEKPSESTVQQPTPRQNATAQEPDSSEEQPSESESTTQQPTPRQNATAREPASSSEQPESEQPASTTRPQTPQSQSDDNSSASSPSTTEETTPAAPDETAKQDTTRSDSGI